MKQLFCFIFIAFAFFISGYECNEQQEQEQQQKQVKISYVHLRYTNPKYIESLDYNITKFNETYNNLGFSWELNKDFPDDVELVSEVYANNCVNKNKKRLVYKVSIPLCENSIYRQYLPKGLVVPKSELGGTCIKEGTYEFEDLGQLRFEELIPKLETKGECFKVDYRIVSGKQLIKHSQIYSKLAYPKIQEESEESKEH